MPNYTKKKKRLKGDEPPIGRLLGRIGMVTRQPLFWASVTIPLANADGPQGPRAARRGVVGYLIAAALGNGLKPVFGRPQPRHRRAKKPQIIFGAFPSGHSAAETAYVLGASQEMPKAFLPLGTAAMLGHWALVRARKHYDSDVIAGAAIGAGVALGMAKLWPAARATVGPFPDLRKSSGRIP
ncbi:MAG: phosphatase PAP2 family protein [Actinomycetota bacterium]